MTSTTTDTRSMKGLELAIRSAEWTRETLTDGRPAYRIPSSRGNGASYLVTVELLVLLWAELDSRLHEAAGRP